MADLKKLKDITENKIYELMKQCSVNHRYASKLVDRQIINSKRFDIILAILSAVSAILTIFQIDITSISLVIVTISLISKQIFPMFFLKTEDFNKLGTLEIEYIKYEVRASILFDNLHTDVIDVIEAQQELDKLLNEISNKQTEISRIFGKIIKKLADDSANESDAYIDNIYNKNKKDGEGSTE